MIGPSASAQGLGLITEDIVAYCESQWPGDYVMFNDCFDRQVEAKQAFIAGLEHVKTGSQVDGIMSKCSKQWTGANGTDFVMVVDCATRQMDALTLYRQRKAPPLAGVELCDTPNTQCEDRILNK